MFFLLLTLTTAPAGAQPPPEAPTIFKCCDDPQLQRIVERYLRWTEALVGGERNPAGHLYTLLSMLTPSPGLSSRENAAIAELHEQVGAARNLSGEALQPYIQRISQDMVYLALRHEGGDLTVAEAGCPERGSWLQRNLNTPLDLFGDGCGRWR